MVVKPFILTVDTEPDNGDWQDFSAQNLSFTNLEGLKRFSELAKQYGIRPTLLVTYSIAAHPHFEKVLQQSKLLEFSEIGTHFHPADTPPFGEWDAKDRDNLQRVADLHLEEKFMQLHNLLTQRFGLQRSFRGGTWAMDARLLKLLRNNHYKIDSTVTPGISWLLNHRPSYLNAPAKAYRLDFENPSKAGESSLWEIPVSIESRSELPSWVAACKLGSLLSMPMYSRKLPLVSVWRKLRPKAPVWLRPAFTEIQEMRHVVAKLQSSGYVHGMCHSNELWPGTSPYTSSPQECDRFFSRLEGLFRIAIDGGFKPMTLSESAQVLTV